VTAVAETDAPNLSARFFKTSASPAWNSQLLLIHHFHITLRQTCWLQTTSKWPADLSHGALNSTCSHTLTPAGCTRQLCRSMQCSCTWCSRQKQGIELEEQTNGAKFWCLA